MCHFRLFFSQGNNICCKEALFFAVELLVVMKKLLLILLYEFCKAVSWASFEIYCGVSVLLSYEDTKLDLTFICRTESFPHVGNPGICSTSSAAKKTLAFCPLHRPEGKYILDLCVAL